MDYFYIVFLFSFLFSRIELHKLARAHIDLHIHAILPILMGIFKMAGLMSDFS